MTFFYDQNEGRAIKRIPIIYIQMFDKIPGRNTL